MAVSAVQPEHEAKSPAPHENEVKNHWDEDAEHDANVIENACSLLGADEDDAVR